MKASLFCTNSYLSPEPLHQHGWPTPPRLYRPEVGVQSARAALDLARCADEAGFDWVSCSEHHYTARLQTPNPAVFAAALTQVVNHARIAVLGPLVSMTNPVRTAEELAMLDQLSGGRAVALFLRGTPNEFLAYGVDPGETRSRTQEATQLILRALTEPEPFSWVGRHFTYRTVSVWPGCIQRPHPPVYYSGNSMESAGFAAANRLGLGISYYPPHLVARLTHHYRTESARHGWQPTSEQLIYRTFLGVAETDEEADGMRDRFLGLAGLGLSLGRGAAAGRPSLTDAGLVPSEIGTDGDGRNPQADRGAAGFGFGGLQFCGSPDTVLRQIETFHRQTGVGVLDIGFGGPGMSADEAARSFALFSAEVLPRLRAIGVERPAPLPATAAADAASGD